MSDRKSIESILSELGKKIDHLINETKKAGTKVSEEMESKIRDLKKQKDKLEEEIRDRSENSGEKWSHAKGHLNEAADSIRKAFKVLFKKDAS
ncbi:MAG: hypothetical protein GDA51_02020 [Ekhidna sp.]|nr:hypothetical protein [Ekhidna sp.]MBC6411218.1 hypothetical protein [Ekhidna sp.]MBC6425252.1 hypothetical protein [Ekhidna sp.]